MKILIWASSFKRLLQLQRHFSLQESYLCLTLDDAKEQLEVIDFDMIVLDGLEGKEKIHQLTQRQRPCLPKDNITQIQS